MEKLRVLGLSIGNRKIGVAVLERHCIFDYQMKSFNDCWSKEKLSSILSFIERLFAEHMLTHIAVKIPPICTHSLAIKEFVKGLETFTEERRITLFIYTIEDLKRSWLQKTQIDKKQFMESVLKKYPDLHHEFKRQTKTKAKHFEKIFEAVGAADLVLRNYC